MQPEDRDMASLWDMLQAAMEATKMLEGMDVETFTGDTLHYRAVERCMEIVGEAARRISDGFRNAHPEIAWQEVIGQRNIITHEYGHVDHFLLYRTVRNDIPVLIHQLEPLLSKLKNQ